MELQPTFNTVQDGRKVLTDLWDSYPFLSEVDQIKADFNDRIETINPDEISRYAVKLSVYLCNIGGMVAELTAKANESYIFRKFKYNWEFTSLKKEIKGDTRKMEAENNTFPYHRDELINRFVADHMKTYKEDLERLVSAIQSRLRTLQSERISGYMDAKQERTEY